MCVRVFGEGVDKELGRRAAGGACPCCGGKVAAVEVESKCRFCLVPVGFVVKKKYICTNCSKRLVLR
ncbi:hypothetical protein ACP275_10G074800 [Erythranthe tilingii]